MRILRVKDPVPIQLDVDIVDNPYIFEYNWTNVNNQYVNFHDSYMELTFQAELNQTDWDKTILIDDEVLDLPMIADGQLASHRVHHSQVLKHYAEQVIQDANTYDLIDSVDIEMVYGTPDGGSKALKYHEPSLNATRGRKMIALKEMSSDELDKSVYGEDLSSTKEELSTMRMLFQESANQFVLAIPFYLICGLGTDANNIINIKQLKMMIRTSTINSIMDNKQTVRAQINNEASGDLIWYTLSTPQPIFTAFRLKSVIMNLMTYTDLPVGPEVAPFTVPSYIQMDYQAHEIKKESFNVNRALPYIPEYVLFWFTKGVNPFRISNIPTNGIQPTYLSCLMGNSQMFPQTEFPLQKYPYHLTKEGRVDGKSRYKDIVVPNKSLYALWADNSHPETKLKYDKWLDHPIYIIPCSSMMDVSGNSGIEMNFECHLNVYDHDKRFINEYQVPDGYELLEQEDGKDPVWYNPENVKEPATRAHIYPLLQDTFEKSGPYTLHMLAVRNIQDF